MPLDATLSWPEFDNAFDDDVSDYNVLELLQAFYDYKLGAAAADAARRESADDSSCSDGEASSEDALRAELKRLNGELDSNNTEFVSSLSFLDETDNALKQGPYAATATTAFQSTLHK